MIKEVLFYSKILLFGEYGIIKDAMGLSIPYSYYKGKLDFCTKNDLEDKKSNQYLKKYYVYLKELQKKSNSKLDINLKKLKTDINNGLCFSSNIPQGFGVGSSGALVAAIYNVYCNNKILLENNESLILLKEIFAEMEDYFHGKSSGIDPLICFLKNPILIDKEKKIKHIGIPQYLEGNGAVFLLNSGIPGKTSTMIDVFMQKMKHHGFRKMLKSEFKKYNDACIQAFLKGDILPLLSNIKELSTIILENFKPMIPIKLLKSWKEGIETNSFYLKLCGSGGGGFMIGFTKDIKKTKEILNEYNLEVIYKL